jgi:hypothetical protein
MLIERFEGRALTLGDIEKFVERAMVLGHNDKTSVGVPGVGLELYIAEQMPQGLYCQETGCVKVFNEDQLLFEVSTHNWCVPNHIGPRGYNCGGAGKPGVSKK